MPSTPDSTTASPSPRAVRWIGGVVQPYAVRRGGKPVRIAAWITRCGLLLDAALVSSKGPSLLRRMLDEQLMARSDRRPSRITVWPSVRSAFGDLAFPTVEVAKDDFLKIVVDDMCSFGQLQRQVGLIED